MEFSSELSNSSTDDQHELLPSASNHIASDSVDDLPTLEKRMEEEKHGLNESKV